METATAYLPMDRRHALSQGSTLPERMRGAALFADISGFTPLAEALVQELGPRRGADELTRHLNQVYDALIAEVHRYRGSVVSFSGDAVTCWLDGDDGARATACALAMQRAMAQFAAVTTASASTASIGIKAAVAAGAVGRFLVGDPTCGLLEVVAGTTVDRLEAAGHLADRGEVILAPEVAASLGDRLLVVAWRLVPETGERFAVAAHLSASVPDCPWPPIPPEALTAEMVRPWLLPPVFQRLLTGQGEFLAELRPAVALFLRFGGIDYDHDPAAADKLDIFVRGIQEVAGRYDGSLLSLSSGDKGSYLFVTFGAPIAHEDDAARAAFAALDLQGMATRLGFLSAVQIGIAQGRMRTGAYGSQASRTYGVLGDAVNLAARLMSASGPGQILVSEQTAAATGGLFVWQSQPALEVKGKRNPVPASRLAGLRRDRSIRLFEPRYALPLIGRQAELATIEHKLALVTRGQGQIAGLTGEAGIGKSRLMAEAVAMARERGLVGYGGECQSYATNASYVVWGRIWRDLFALDATAPVADQVQALSQWLSLVDPGLVPRLPLLGLVLSLPIPDNDLTRRLEAKVRKASLEAMLVQCLQAQAASGPLFLVLEDCHWLDPLSHELLEEIGRAIARLPVLILLAYRPPDVQRLQAPRVSRLPYFTEVALSEFTPHEAEQLVRHKLAQALGPGVELPSDLTAWITAKAAGNPFYIEELLNYLQDRGIDPRDREALDAVDLPGSLHSLVLSRIDQLTQSQQATVKVASVVGRLFAAAMLWGVFPQLGAPEHVLADLQFLSDAELTPLESREPELTYLFKHIVTQQVAYESLLEATRAVLHEQIGMYLERTYPDRLPHYVNLLAFHYERSENDAKKREYLLKAGEAAQAGYANQAAVEYYQKLLPLLPPADQAPALLKLGKVGELIGDWEMAGRQYEHALALATDLADRHGQARCQTAIGELARKRGDYSGAAAWLDQAQATFVALGDDVGLGEVLHFAGTLADQQGYYEAARRLYLNSLAIRRKIGDRPRIGSLLSNLGIVARRQGDLELARSLYEESLAVRREVNDRWAIAITLNNIGNLELDLGRCDEARARLEEAVALQREVGDRWMIGNALNNLGNVARAQGQTAEARTLYHESLEIYGQLGDKWALAYLLEDVATLSAVQGHAEQALALAAAAQALRRQIGAPLTGAESSKLENALAPARERLGEAEQAAAWAQGEALSLDEAIRTILGD